VFYRRRMLSFEEARSRLLASVRPLSSERVPTVAGLGRVLAEPVRAVRDVPSFDYSAMDGYAVRAADFVGAPPFRFPVTGESRTGQAPAPMQKGESFRIFTGAELPAGADAVVMQEQAVRTGDQVTFDAGPTSGAFVRRRGEDLVDEQIALEKGTRLSPYGIALAASVEAPWLTVTRRPVVSILTTGDELRALGEPIRSASIVDAIGPALAAFVTSLGGIPRVLATAGDDRQATEQSLRSAFEGADVVLTVGGVSVGEHDVVKASLESIGATLDFWRVAIKPGKPLAVGSRGGVPFLGLPGNPTSALLTFTLFGAPLLRTLSGDRRPLPPTSTALLGRPLRRSPGRKEFIRAQLRQGGSLACGEDVPPHMWVAEPLPNQASGAATSLAWADALIVVDADAEEIAEGSSVEVLRLSEV
jgi:molybdopterin molybdotransferase